MKTTELNKNRMNKQQFGCMWLMVVVGDDDDEKQERIPHLREIRRTPAV
jgi:hypothetical protein